MTISPFPTNQASLHATQGKRPLDAVTKLPAPSPEAVADAKELRDTFSHFVGVTLLGKALGAMRKSVGEPAYFHGGQAERVFQSQLDQAMVDEMTAEGPSPLAAGLFEHQFPDAADLLRRDAAARPGEDAESKTGLEDLSNLRRL